MARVAIGAGFFGTGLQIVLQVHQAKYGTMPDYSLWTLIVIAAALMGVGLIYLAWHFLVERLLIHLGLKIRTFEVNPADATTVVSHHQQGGITALQVNLGSQENDIGKVG